MAEMENTVKIVFKEMAGWRDIKNKLFFGLVILLSFITISPVVMIIYKLVVKGVRQINLDFFIKIAPDTLQAMTAVNNHEIIPGGIANGITGTLVIVAVASALAIPVGILIGIFLYENQGSKYADLIRNLTDI
jgi:phosphate transport system permease protein